MNYFLQPLFISTLFLVLIVVKCNDDELKFLRQFNKLRNLLQDTEEKGQIINGVLILEKEIGKGSSGIVWEGSLLEKRGNDMHERPVAIKFGIHKIHFNRECDILTRLRSDSGNVEDVEKYGIPALYYNGTFGQYPVMATTLLELDLLNYYLRLDSFQPDNQLRIFYQVVSTLRYIHSKNIVHNDLKPNNLMFRDGQIFIIDFDLAEHIGTRNISDLKNYGANTLCCSIAVAKSLPRHFIDDLKSLYYALLNIDHIKLPWQKLSRTQDLIQKITNLRLNRTKVRGLCDELRSEELQYVYRYFHDAVHDPYPKNIDSIEEDTRTPDYDGYLNVALKFIEYISGSKDTSIYWPIELAVKIPTLEIAAAEERSSNIFLHLESISKLEQRLNKIANENDRIEDKLALLSNKKLWNARDMVVWQGIRYSKSAPNGTKVEIKAGKNTGWLTRERQIYDMMGAIKNPEVEIYGIQAVYTLVEISEKYDAMAFTLCPERLIDRIEQFGQISPVNILRVLYQAILTLKFIHSKGIVHEMLIPESFLIRGSRLFITGFEYSELNRLRSKKITLRPNFIFGSACTTLKKHGSFMDDFKSLFYIMLNFLGIELPWQHLTEKDQIVKLKMKHKENIVLCFKIEDPTVQRVLLVYYLYVIMAYPYGNDTKEVKIDLRIPFYTAMGNMVLDGIEKISKSKDAHFDWPSNIPKTKIPSIESIKNPRQKIICIFKK